jgi:hypothetical protein
MSDLPLASFSTLSLGVCLASVSLAGQNGPIGMPVNRAAAGSTWTAPRTPDGYPDLQGIWVSNSATPLERPKALAGKPFLTDEEVADLKKRADRLFRSGDSDFAAGDNVFLAALNNLERYKSAGSTENSVGMIDRPFDNRTSLIIDPPDGRIPAVTETAQSRLAGVAKVRQRPPSGPEDLSNAYRSITTEVPKLGGLYGSGHFSFYQIVQSPGYVVIVTETIHDARIIPLDQRPHLPQTVRLWNGDSRGRWVENTLIVDTSNFSHKSDFMGAAENLHLIERFTRVAPDTINYEITIDDPTTWTRPWTAAILLKQTPDKMYEFACHEGNRPMVGMLSGARADERAAEEAARRLK